MLMPHMPPILLPATTSKIPQLYDKLEALNLTIMVEKDLQTNIMPWRVKLQRTERMATCTVYGYGDTEQEALFKAICRLPKRYRSEL